MHPLSDTRRRDESKGYVNVILCWIVKVPRRTPIARHRKVHCVGSLQESYVRQFVFCHSQLCKFWFGFMHKHCCTHDHFICRHARCICIGGRSFVDCAKDVCKLALLACVHAGDRMLIKQYLRAWYEQHVSSQQYLDGPMLWQEPVPTDNMTRSSYLLGKHKVDMLPLQTLVQWSGDRVRTPVGQGCGMRPVRCSNTFRNFDAGSAFRSHTAAVRLPVPNRLITDWLPLGALFRTASLGSACMARS